MTREGLTPVLFANKNTEGEWSGLIPISQEMIDHVVSNNKDDEDFYSRIFYITQRK